MQIDRSTMCVMFMLFILPLLLSPLEAVSGREMLFQMDIEADDVMWVAPFFDDDNPAFAAQRFVDIVAAQFGHDSSHATDPIARMLVERRALFGDNLEMEPRGPVLFSVPAPSGLGGAALPDVYFHEGDDPVMAWRRFFGALTSRNVSRSAHCALDTPCPALSACFGHLRLLAGVHRQRLQAVQIRAAFLGMKSRSRRSATTFWRCFFSLHARSVPRSASRRARSEVKRR